MAPLPTREDAGVQRVETPSGPVTFRGRRLGYGTSHMNSHRNHSPGSFPRRGERCSGCRWTEARIFWSEDHEQYVVSTIGRSVVPSEVDKITVVWTADPGEVVDALLVSRARFGGDDLELPPPNADALEEAARSDTKLSEAFAEWNRGD